MDNPKSSVNLSDSTAGDSAKSKIIRTMEQDMEGITKEVARELESQKVAPPSSKPLSMPPAAAQMKKSSVPMPPPTSKTSPVPPTPISPTPPKVSPPPVPSKPTTPPSPKPPIVSKTAPKPPEKPAASPLAPKKASFSKKELTKKETPAGEIKIPEKGKKPSLKFAFIIGGTALVVIGLVGGLYLWKKSPKQKVVPPIVTPPISTIPEPTLPITLISSTFDEKIQISGADKDIILQELSGRSDQSGTNGDFRRILITLSTESEKRYLSLGDILQVLEVNIPDELANNLGENYTMFFYNQKDEGRLGLISQIQDPEIVRTIMTNWEGSIKNDLNFMFLNETLEPSPVQTFQDNSYKGIQIRYLNFPTADFTVDYAVIPEQNLLIITTSKESMYKVIDQIVE